MRWLKQHAQGSQSIAAATQSELQALFKCRTIEEIEARPVLTVESKAVLEILETERGRSRIVQGGVANPNDWFLTPTEESILTSLMSNATLNVTGDDDPKASERSKVEQPRVDIERQKLQDRVAEANRRLVQDQLPQPEARSSNRITTDRTSSSRMIHTGNYARQSGRGGERGANRNHRGRSRGRKRSPSTGNSGWSGTRWR